METIYKFPSKIIKQNSKQRLDLIELHFLMSEDHDLLALRQKLISIVPDLKNEIEIMGREDLEQLLKLAEGEVDDQKQMERNQMIKQILILCPDIGEEEFKHLSDTDVKQIYQKYKNRVEEQKKKKKKEQDKKKKKKIKQNGELNAYQMKKILIDKLPGYRDDIIKLGHDKIKKMYRELQENDEEIQKEEKPMADPSSNFSQAVASLEDNEESIYENSQQVYRALDTKVVRKRGRPKITKDPNELTFDKFSYYGEPKKSVKPLPRLDPDRQSQWFNQGQIQQPAYQMPPLRQQNESEIYRQSFQLGSKASKSIRKCKITFYLDYSDLQDSNEEDQEQKDEDEHARSKKRHRRAKNKLVQIIRSVHEAFSDKQCHLQ